MLRCLNQGVKGDRGDAGIMGLPVSFTALTPFSFSTALSCSRFRSFAVRHEVKTGKNLNWSLQIFARILRTFCV